jgi:hypothetical protein
VPDTGLAAIEDAKRLPRILAEAGVDYEDVTETLEEGSRSSWTRSTNFWARYARRAASWSSGRAQEAFRDGVFRRGHGEGIAKG